MTQPRNIQERTFEFAVRVVKLVDRLPKTTSGMQLGRQLVASGTSVGANMQEADGAETKKDFVHKTGVALKEAKESHFWLRVIDATLLQKDSEVKSMVQEARELSLIIGAIKRNAHKGKDDTD
ncbi:MAG: four helix bundle protein [Chloroflexota bacterium]